MTKEIEELQHEAPLTEDENSAPEEYETDASVSGDESADETDSTPDEAEIPDEIIDFPEAAAVTDEYDAHSSVSAEKKHRVRAPIIIAAVILLLTVTAAVLWAGFFYKSIKGCWKYMVTVGEGGTAAEYSYLISFEDDGVCRYNLGGTTYKGKYKLDSSDGRNKVTIILSSLGREVYNKSFYYETEGNFFSKRTLYATDIDGMILPPDDLSNEDGVTASLKMKLADSKEEDGKRYYIIPFSEASSIEPRVKKYDDYKTDDILTGTWYEANENSGYGYTFTFEPDGTYELIYSDISYNGCYTAENGICKYNLMTNDGEELESQMNYSLDGKKLILDVNGQKSTLVKTDNKFAFEGAIK